MGGPAHRRFTFQLQDERGNWGKPQTFAKVWQDTSGNLLWKNRRGVICTAAKGTWREAQP